jgi:hypothetical protein
MLFKILAFGEFGFGFLALKTKGFLLVVAESVFDPAGKIAKFA